jgi:hypothetical protein
MEREPLSGALDDPEVRSSETLSELDTLPYRLGFVESEVAKANILEAMAGDDPSWLQEAWRQYYALAEKQLELLNEDDAAYARAQAGIMVAKAMIFREGGNEAREYLELLHAYELEDNMDFVELAPIKVALNAGLDEFGNESPALAAAIEMDEEDRAGGASALMNEAEPT